jgi:hypothetical protein
MLHDYQVEVANLALKEQRGIIKCATGNKFKLQMRAIYLSIIISYMSLLRSLLYDKYF